MFMTVTQDLGTAELSKKNMMSFIEDIYVNFKTEFLAWIKNRTGAFKDIFQSISESGMSTLW